MSDTVGGIAKINEQSIDNFLLIGSKSDSFKCPYQIYLDSHFLIKPVWDLSRFLLRYFCKSGRKRDSSSFTRGLWTAIGFISFLVGI